jgi:hypothetical protein
MAGQNVRVVIDHGAVRALLNSVGIVAILESHGNRVAASASAMTPSDSDTAYGPAFEAQTYTGGTRARVYVRPANMDGFQAEAVHGVLTKALGGA